MRHRIIVYMATLMLPLSLLLGHPWNLFGEAPSGSKVRRYVSEDSLLTPEEPGVDEWKFTADRVVGDHNSEYAEAFGNVSLSSDPYFVQADYARYYRASNWVFLKGNVRATWGSDFLEADEAEFDLTNKQGWLKRGKAFLAEPHLYVESKMIRRYRGDSYHFKDAKLTGCSGDRPAWSVTAEEGHINLDSGRVKLWNTTTKAWNVPFFYLPYFSFVRGEKRQSGLLMPTPYSSSRLGLGVELPYYWAIDEEHDMTFYTHFMSKRGLMQGVEFRHANDTATKGVWQFNFLNDNVVHKAESDEDEMFRGDGLTRKNRNRWWARGKFDGYIGNPKWRTMVDLDLVSDQNYLREFSRGESGYSASQDEFMDKFSRGLDAADSVERKNRVLVHRSWDKYGLAGKLEYTQNLEYWNDNKPSDKDPTVQRLPEVDFFAYKDSLIGPLEWEAQAKYDFFWRKYGTTANRLDLHPVLSLPLKAGGVTVIPRLGLRQTMYGVNQYENEDPSTTDNKYPVRFMYEGGVSAFTELQRVYSFGGDGLVASKANQGKSRWSSMKHSIIPRIDYSYIPNSNRQESLPYFDELDRIPKTNEITYSLTNVFDRHRESVTMSAEGDDSKPILSSDYLDFARFMVEQSYDWNEAVRNDELDRYERRPFSDVLAQITLKPEDYITLDSKTWISPYIGAVTEHLHTLTLSKEGWGDISFSYDYLRNLDEYKRRRTDPMQILGLRTNVDLSDAWSLQMGYRRDFESNKDLEKSIGLTWRHECFSAGFLFAIDENDNRYELNFDLFNF